MNLVEFMLTVSHYFENRAGRRVPDGDNVDSDACGAKAPIGVERATADQLKVPIKRAILLPRGRVPNGEQRILAVVVNGAPPVGRQDDRLVVRIADPKRT